MKTIFTFAFIALTTLVNAQYSGTFASVKFDITGKPVCIYELDQGGVTIRKETYVSLKDGLFMVWELGFNGQVLESIFQYSLLSKNVDLSESDVYKNLLNSRKSSNFFNIYINMNAGTKVKCEVYYTGGAEEPTEANNLAVSFTDKAVADDYFKKFRN